MTGFTISHQGHNYRVTVSWQNFKAVNQAIQQDDIMAVCSLAVVYGYINR